MIINNATTDRPEKPMFIKTSSGFRVSHPAALAATAKAAVSRMHALCPPIERFLILFAALAGWWFMFFDVYPPNDILGSFALKSVFWQAVFFSAVGFHLITLYFDSTAWRVRACLYHSSIWCLWIFLAVTAEYPTMATPFLSGLFAMGLYEAICLKVKK